MAKTDLENQLALAQKEYEAERLKLEERFNKKTEQLLANAKEDLAKFLKGAMDCYTAIPESKRKEVWSDPDLTKVLKTLGLKTTEAKSQSKGRRSRITDEMIVDYLGTMEKESGTQNVKEHFQISALTASKRLNALLKAKKVTMRKEGTSKFWRKA